jgi:hypothetical protein
MLFSTFGFAQSYEWAGSIGGSIYDEGGGSIAIDGGGNCYIAGNFLGTADFDFGPGITSLISAGDYDIFIAKYSANGNCLWAKQLGGYYNEGAGSIAIDSMGNCYITGSYEYPDLYSLNNDSTNSRPVSNDEIFFAKFDANGNLLWTKTIISPNSDYGFGIALDDFGHLFITGLFSDTADFDLGFGTAILTPIGTSDIFFAKYDTSGNYIWAKSIGGTNGEISYAINIDITGNCFITGTFRDSADFDPGIGIAKLFSVGQDDIFFAKYDSAGNYLWAKSIGSSVSGDEYGTSIALGKVGNCYIAGCYSGTADFDPGVGTVFLTPVHFSDIFFAKYDANGNYIWAKSIGSYSSDYCRCIALDNSKNCYITGSFSSIADFDPDIGTAILCPVGDHDIFFAKYDTNGNYIWAENVGSTVGDFGNSISIDSMGNCYLTGSFQNTADFDPGAGTANLTSVGGQDIFIAKYSPTIVGIKENIIIDSIIIYPNPTTKNLTIETQQKATIEILNIEGQIIKTLKSEEKETTIDLSSISSGIYIIKAKTEKGIVVKKFIKE